MKSDFKPVADHRFNFRGDWGAVDCRVLTIEPNKTLSYTWDAMGLESVVTRTLTPTGTGTHLRMEQWLPAGPAAGLSRRQFRLAEVLRKPGADFGTGRLKSAGDILDHGARNTHERSYQTFDLPLDSTSSAAFRSSATSTSRLRKSSRRPRCPVCLPSCYAAFGNLDVERPCPSTIDRPV